MKEVILKRYGEKFGKRVEYVISVIRRVITFSHFLGEVIIIFIFGAVFFAHVKIAFCNVAIKIVVVNPLASQERNVPVRYDLPSGIGKEDILFTNGLKVNYDEQKGVYYVYGKVKLGPKESRTLKIVIRDIWKISQKEIESLMKALDEKIDSIEDSKEKETAMLLGERLKEKLKAVSKQQAELESDIEKRMEVYPVFQRKIESIKDSIFSLDKLVKFGGQESDYEKEVILVIEVKNTFDREIVVPVKYYLPQEITPEYIIDKGEFDLKYDFERKQFYLVKEEKLGPKEVKRYNIRVKDVWHFPEEIVSRYVKEAEQWKEKIIENKEGLTELVEVLFSEIQKNAKLIIDSQEKRGSVKENIYTYRINQKRMRIIKDDLEKLRSFMKKMGEEKQKVPSEKKKVKKMFREVNYLVRLKKASEFLFKEKVKGGSVWKVVMVIVLFVMGLTTFFYGLWFIKLRKEEKRKLKKIGFSK